MKLAVVIPVGPAEHHTRWLGECLASLAAQTRTADLVVFVDDMRGLSLSPFTEALSAMIANETVVVHNEWRLGVAASFNVGVARAHARGADLAFMQGADDTMEIGCLEAVERTYLRGGGRDGYYWCDIRYSDTGEEQALPCNMAAVTPGLWRRTGGFSPEMGAGAPDAALISILLRHEPASLIHVASERPLLMHRRHEHQETARRAPGVEAIRDWLTTNYEPADWGRTT